MNEHKKKEIQELINLLYNNHISQYGKRKLEKYIKEMQKEIEDLKTITRAYNSYMCDDVNFKILIADARYFFYDGGYFVDRFISKDKITELIANHKKFLFDEFSHYEENDIENRKAIQYASARLTFLLEDIYKIGEYNELN